MAFAIIALTLAAMVLVALRANRRLAHKTNLPMNFGLDGRPGWSAPRHVALAFMPALAACILLPLVIALPDRTGTEIGALWFLGGQWLHLHLIGRHA
jgi:hypothetical protein